MKALAEFTIWSLPPTVNNLYGRLPRTVYKKSEVREWQIETISSMRKEWGAKPAIKTLLELRIEFTSRTHRKWDVDNRIKPLQDCLERAGVIKNDAQIWRVEAERKIGSCDSTWVQVVEYHER